MPPPINPLSKPRALGQIPAAAPASPLEPWGQFAAARTQPGGSPFWHDGAGAAPKTTYKSDGSIVNPPAEDPGYRVYNHVSEMPAQDQGEIHAYRAGVAGGGDEAVGFSSMPPTPFAPHQAMIADPAKSAPAIGVPARNQAPAIGVGGGFLSVAPGKPAYKGPSFATPADMRAAMIGDLTTQMQQAHTEGDTAKLSHLFAQRAALDNGGFVGHANFMADAAMNEAKMAQLGVKTGASDRKGGVDLEKLRADTLLRTGDEAQADKAVQNMRIAQARKEATKSGKPVNVDPNDAGAILAQNYPIANQYFGSNQDDRAKYSLADIYHNLKATVPSLLNDPTSEFSQAASARIRQIFGEDLNRELDVPSSGSLIGNALAGHYFELDPWAAQERKTPAVNWFNSIQPPPPPQPH